MSMQNLKDTINSVVCSTLERTAFMFPDPAEEFRDSDFESCKLIMTRLNYSGNKEGQVSLIVTTDFCLELSVNMLGEEIDDQSENFRDALKETLNIIVGQLLIKLYGGEAIFNLTAPEICELTKDDFCAIISENNYALAYSDEWPIITILDSKKEANEHSSISS